MYGVPSYHNFIAFMNLIGVIVSQADKLLVRLCLLSAPLSCMYGFRGTMFFPIIFCRSSVEAAMYGYGGTMFFPFFFCRSSVEAAMYGYGGTMFFSIIFCRSSAERL
jgi:hypothetical protein